MKSVARISVLGMMISCPEEIAYRMGFGTLDTSWSRTCEAIAHGATLTYQFNFLQV